MTMWILSRALCVLRLRKGGWNRWRWSRKKCYNKKKRATKVEKENRKKFHSRQTCRVFFSKKKLPSHSRSYATSLALEFSAKYTKCAAAMWFSSNLMRGLAFLPFQNDVTTTMSTIKCVSDPKKDILNRDSSVIAHIISPIGVFCWERRM